MSATVEQIRLALANNLSSILGVQVSPYILGNPTPPTIYLIPGTPGGGEFTQFDIASTRGLDKQTYTVRAIAGTPTDIGPQIILDGFLNGSGDLSVKQAVESDCHLGGLVSDLRVVLANSYAAFVADGGSPRLAAEFQVDVYV